MARSWKASLRQGLGGRRTCVLGLALVALGVVGKLVLRDYANIETVFVASFLAGSVLGRWWTYLVPFATLAILEPILWGTGYATYAMDVVLGLTFFIATGYLFIAYVGRRIRPRILFRVGSLALLTTVSVPLVIAYDLWTDIGEYYFIARPLGLTFLQVLQLQVPFTIYHLLSSLIFVPLFGAGVLWLHRVAWSARVEEPVPEPDAPSKPAEDT